MASMQCHWQLECHAVGKRMGRAGALMAVPGHDNDVPHVRAHVQLCTTSQGWPSQRSQSAIPRTAADNCRATTCHLAQLARARHIHTDRRAAAGCRGGGGNNTIPCTQRNRTGVATLGVPGHLAMRQNCPVKDTYNSDRTSRRRPGSPPDKAATQTLDDSCLRGNSTSGASRGGHVGASHKRDTHAATPLGHAYVHSARLPRMSYVHAPPPGVWAMPG